MVVDMVGAELVVGIGCMTFVALGLLYGLVHGSMFTDNKWAAAAMRKGQKSNAHRPINVNGTDYYVIEVTHFLQDWQKKPTDVT